MSRSRVLIIIFALTAFLIFTIQLRNSSARLFNQSRSSLVTQEQLKQQLWNQQLRFECLINPAGLPASEPSKSTEEMP